MILFILTWVAAFVLKANPMLFVGAATVSTILFVVAIIWTLLLVISLLIALAAGR